VQALKRFNPIQSPSIDKINRVAHTTPGTDKGHLWVKESLREHNLTAQLQILVNNKEHLQQFYFRKTCNSITWRTLCLIRKTTIKNKIDWGL
jgi:hypothetical protein